jgi:hypothetical protein
MHRKVVLTLLLAISSKCYSGVETLLFESELQGCKIEVSHSAAIGATTGTILFSTYKIIDGIHWACEVTKEAVTNTLTKGLSVFNSVSSLVPVSSIRIGHIQHYKWAKELLHKQSQEEQRAPTGYQEFNQLVASNEVSLPFKLAINSNGFKLKKADCEKRFYYKNGATEDAFCWLIIKRT